MTAKIFAILFITLISSASLANEASPPTKLRLEKLSPTGRDLLYFTKDSQSYNMQHVAGFRYLLRNSSSEAIGVAAVLLDAVDEVILNAHSQPTSNTVLRLSLDESSSVVFRVYEPMMSHSYIQRPTFGSCRILEFASGHHILFVHQKLNSPPSNDKTIQVARIAFLIQIPRLESAEDSKKWSTSRKGPLSAACEKGNVIDVIPTLPGYHENLVQHLHSGVSSLSF